MYGIFLAILLQLLTRRGVRVPSIPTLPPLTLPTLPITLPTLPPITLPKTLPTLPRITLPPITLPPVTLPRRIPNPFRGFGKRGIDDYLIAKYKRAIPEINIDESLYKQLKSIDTFVGDKITNGEL